MTYQLSVSSELMENHISATVLDAGKAMAAIHTSAGVEIIVSLGTDNKLRASIETAPAQHANAAGWAVMDLSEQLQNQYGNVATATAKTFAISRNTNTNETTLFVVANVINHSASLADTTPHDELLIATAQSAGQDASVWLLDPQKTLWKRLAYDNAAGDPPPQISAATLTIDDLRFEAGLGDDDAPFVLASVVDPDDTSHRQLFTIDPSASTAWTYFAQPSDIDTRNGLMLAVGKLDTSDDMGLYKCFFDGRQQTLSFIELGTQQDVVLDIGDQTVTAIASVLYDDGGTNSDLFVTVDGALHLISQSDRAIGDPIIKDPKLLNNVQSLHAVNAGGMLVIWGANGAGQAFHARVNFDERADPTKWSTLLVFLQNASAVCPLIGADHDDLSLFAVAKTTGVRLVGPLGGDGAPIPLRLSRNAQGNWHKTPLPMPTTSDTIALQSYTTRLRVTDDQGVPQGNVAVSVSASSNAGVYINGQPFNLSTTGTDIVADMFGAINIVHPGGHLTTPSLTFTLPDGSAPTTHPGAAVRAKLGTLSAADLQNATYTDADGTTHPVVADGQQAQIASVADALSKIDQVQEKAGVGATVSLGNPLDFLGDLVQSLIDGVTAVVTVVADVVGDTVTLTLTLIDSVMTFTLTAFEDVLNAMTAAIAWIARTAEAAFRWLAFLLDWTAYVHVAGCFNDALSQVLSSSVSDIDKLKAAADSWCATLKAQIEGYQLPDGFVAQVGSGSLNATWAANQPKPDTSKGDLRTDSRLGWVQDRGTDPKTSTALALHRAIRSSNVTFPPALRDDFDGLIDQIGSLVTDIVTQLKRAWDDIKKLVNGEGDSGQVLADLVKALAETAVDILQTIVDTFLGLLEKIVGTLKEVLTGPIDVPIISPLFRASTGNTLTVGTLICLLPAIVVTIAFRTIKPDQDPAKLITDLNLPDEIKALFDGRASGAAAKNSDPELTRTLSGGLFLVQAMFMVWVAFEEATEGDEARPRLNNDDPSSLVEYAYVFEAFTRSLRGLLELQYIPDEESGESLRVKIVTAASCSCFVSSLFCLWLADDAKKKVEIIRCADAGLSMVWGVWELIAMWSHGHCKVEPSAAAIVEILEVIEVASFKVKEPEVGGILAALRVIAAGTTGFARFFPESDVSRAAV